MRYQVSKYHTPRKEINNPKFLATSVLTIIISIDKTNGFLIYVFCERTVITLVSYSVSVTVLLIRICSKWTIILKQKGNQQFVSLQWYSEIESAPIDGSPGGSIHNFSRLSGGGGGLWYKLPLNFEVREPQASHVIPASLSCFSNDPQVPIYVTERREVM